MAFLEDAIQEFFIQPIVNPSVAGYNLVNTLVYGIILLAVAFYGIYPFLKKRGFTFDWGFMQSLLPYILFGISLRVLEDQKILTRSPNPLELGFYVFTPGIWILTFALVVIGLVLGHALKHNTRFSSNQITLGFGLLVSVPVFGFNVLNGIEWGAFVGIIVLVGMLSGIIFWIGKKMKWEFLEHPLARLAVVGQMLDASATFVALEFFSCAEQHVVPRALFGAFGNISFFAVKIPLILLLVYYIHKEFIQGKEKDEQMLGFVLIFLSILGLATGGRNLLTILAGTCS